MECNFHDLNAYGYYGTGVSDADTSILLRSDLLVFSKERMNIGLPAFW